ncbi:MAG: hypothetical protein K6E79_08975 [Pseudobutyrivibrio sp.]|nr:hypothetical protein [Pseudobutyrivibrio sp.]
MPNDTSMEALAAQGDEAIISYDISFFDLADCSPKSEKTIEETAPPEFSEDEEEEGFFHKIGNYFKGGFDRLFGGFFNDDETSEDTEDTEE